MKIKKLIIWLVVIMVVCLVIGGILFTIGGKAWLNEEYLDETINQTELISIETTQDLLIRTTSEDINILPYEGSVIKANLHGYMATSENINLPELKYVSGPVTTIYIDDRNDWVFGIWKKNLDLDVYVPRANIKNYAIESVSGNIDAKSIDASIIKASSTSGNLYFEEVNNKELMLTTVSGEITLKNSNVAKFDFGSTSGDIVANGILMHGRAGSISGDISLETTNIDNDWDIDTTSGDIDLTFAKDVDYNINFEAVSGDVRTDVPLIIKESRDNKLQGKNGESEYTIFVNSVSGDFTLN